MTVVRASSSDRASCQTLEPRRVLDGAVLDPTFLDNGGGWPFRADELIERVQPLAGGKILAVGHTSRSTPQSPDLLFVRLNADGRRDASFGDGGRIVRALAGGTLLNIDVNSRGQTAAALRTPDDALIVRRFTAGGAVDRSFDGDGKFTNTLTRGAADALGYRAAIEIDLTESGSVGVCFRKDALFHVARFLPDGRRDAGFGTDGLISFEDSDGMTSRDRVNDAAIGDDGRVLIGGATRSPTDLARQTYAIRDRNGRLVTDTGLQLTGEDDTHIARVTLRPGDGAAFGIGDYFGENWPISDATNTRFENDRNIVDGLPNLNREARLFNIAFGPDGHAYFAGGVEAFSGRTDALIIRLGPDGYVDRTFGNQGFVLFDRPGGTFREGRFEQIEEIAIDPLGRPVLLTRLGEREFELIRLAADQPNPSFAHITKRGTLSIRGGDSDDDVRLEIGTESVIVHRGPFESLVFDASKIARVYFDGGAGNDRFATSSPYFEGSNPQLPWRATLIGGAGDDTLTGGRRPDTLLGGDGDDVLEGWGSSDVLDGGEGDDTIVGGAGNDHLIGGGGRDHLNGQRGDDRLFARDDEPDSLFGGAGRDRAETDATDLVDGVETV